MTLKTSETPRAWQVGDVLINGISRAHVIGTYPIFKIWLEMGMMQAGTQQELEDKGWALKSIKIEPLLQTIATAL